LAGKHHAATACQVRAWWMRNHHVPVRQPHHFERIGSKMVDASIAAREQIAGIRIVSKRAESAPNLSRRFACNQHPHDIGLN